MKKTLIAGATISILTVAAMMTYPHWGMEKISLTCSGEKTYEIKGNTRNSPIENKGFYFERHWNPTLSKFFDAEWSVRFDGNWMRSSWKLNSPQFHMAPVNGSISDFVVQSNSILQSTDPRSQCAVLWDTYWHLDRITGELSVIDHRCNQGVPSVSQIKAQCKPNEKI